MTMAYPTEAMCSVRSRRRQRVTVQPSNTQPHQSTCRNKTTSARTAAARMDSHLFVVSYGLISAELDSAMRENGKVRRPTTPL
jgi:hypothetical protein